MLFRIQRVSDAGSIGDSQCMPRCTDENLEDKMSVGGPGLADIRKSKAGINV